MRCEGNQGKKGGVTRKNWKSFQSRGRVLAGNKPAGKFQRAVLPQLEKINDLNSRLLKEKKENIPEVSL